MLRNLLAWLRARLPGGEPPADSRTSATEADGPADEESNDDGGFLASRLDASVMFAHGASIEAVETDTDDEELVEAEKQAQEFQQERHKYETEHDERY